MFPVAITNEKIYLILFVAIGLTVFVMINSWYVKSCVKSELDDLKKDNKRKKRILQQKQEHEQYEQYMIAQEKQLMAAKQHQQNVQHDEPDMDSYIDPVGNDGASGTQYQNVNAQYKSPVEGEEIDPKKNILMRDIIDNNAMEGVRAPKML